jgi:hypothetical protein
MNPYTNCKKLSSNGTKNKSWIGFHPHGLLGKIGPRGLHGRLKIRGFFDLLPKARFDYERLVPSSVVAL